MDASIPEVLGINRNIVECKDVVNAITKGWLSVLIETQWNVKEAEDCFVLGNETY